MDKLSAPLLGLTVSFVVSTEICVFNFVLWTEGHGVKKFAWDHLQQSERSGW